MGKFLSIGVFLCFLWEKETCYGQFPKSSVTNLYKVTHIQIEKYPRKAEDVNVMPILITPIACLSSLAMFTNDKLLLIPMFIFLVCLLPSAISVEIELWNNRSVEKLMHRKIKGLKSTWSRLALTVLSQILYLFSQIELLLQSRKK